MKTKNSTFKRLKVGHRVRDSWYGPGRVLKKTAQRALIKLGLETYTWNYDVAHVNRFIKIEGQK